MRLGDGAVPVEAAPPITYNGSKREGFSLRDRLSNLLRPCCSAMAQVIHNKLETKLEYSFR